MVRFHEIVFTDSDREHMQRAAMGERYVSKTAQLLSAHLNRDVLLTKSGTAALELAAMALDIGPGDEVIVPSFTFVSTANAFAIRGASIIFCDVREDTLNMDEVLLPSLITKRTKAIVPVHYAGVACEMDAILAHGIPVVEDAAHALFGTYKGRELGTLGSLGVYSFGEQKNFTCGEGGALVISDKRLVDRALVAYEKGTNRHRSPSKFEWHSLGSNFALANPLAGLLYGQLRREAEIRSKREHIWNRYCDALGGRKFAGNAHHIYWGRGFPELPFLQAHYLPLHLSPFGRRYLGKCPVAESIDIRRLPMHANLTDAEVDFVISCCQDSR